jgi:hypothetical protein
MTTKNPNVHHGGGASVIIIVVITINPVVITINPVVITINPVVITIITIDDKDGFLVNSLGDEGMCEILMI